jgi:GT2 family glycosyltransferase
MRSNLGFGAGMNAGVETARDLGAGWFLLLNPDVVIEPAAIRALHGRALDEGTALLAPRLIRPDGSLWSSGNYLLLDDGSMRSASRGAPEARHETWLSGACLLVGADTWDAVGGFGGDYFLYWEDVELSVRVTRAGGRLVVLDDVVAEHAAGGTQGTGQRRAGTAKSDTYYYYNTRNRLLFAARNLDEPDVRRWLRTAWPAARDILLRGGRRQLLRPWRPLTAIGRGTRDGRRLALASLRAADDSSADGDATGR